MADLPEPLTPADSDLRGFDNLQLDVELLPKSKLANYAEPEAFRAAVLLWCEAWKQVPSASLPDDDLELRVIVGLQRDAETWARIKPDALSKFVKCSDGRLYHEILAEKANEAWRRRLEYRERAKAGGKASAKARAKAAGQPQVQPLGSPQAKEGEGEGEGEEDTSLPKGKLNLCSLAEDFWKAFPHPPNRGSKSKVLEKLEKLPIPEQEAALASLTAHKAAIAETRKRNKDFQPCMAETFVDGRRWEGFEPIPPSEIVSREVIWPDDPEEAEKARALQARVGKRHYISYFQKAPPRKNCDGWVVYAQNQFAVDRIDNQYGLALNEIYGRKNWRLEIAP